MSTMNIVQLGTLKRGDTRSSLPGMGGNLESINKIRMLMANKERAGSVTSLASGGSGSRRNSGAVSITDVLQSGLLAELRYKQTLEDDTRPNVETPPWVGCRFRGDVDLAEAKTIRKAGRSVKGDDARPVFSLLRFGSRRNGWKPPTWRSQAVEDGDKENAKKERSKMFCKDCEKPLGRAFLIRCRNCRDGWHEDCLTSVNDENEFICNSCTLGVQKKTLVSQTFQLAIPEFISKSEFSSTVPKMLYILAEQPKIIKKFSLPEDVILRRATVDKAIEKLVDYGKLRRKEDGSLTTDLDRTGFVKEQLLNKSDTNLDIVVHTTKYILTNTVQKTVQIGARKDPPEATNAFVDLVVPHSLLGIETKSSVLATVKLKILAKRQRQRWYERKIKSKKNQLQRTKSTGTITYALSKEGKGLINPEEEKLEAELKEYEQRQRAMLSLSERAKKNKVEIHMLKESPETMAHTASENNFTPRPNYDRLQQVGIPSTKRAYIEIVDDLLKRAVFLFDLMEEDRKEREAHIAEKAEQDRIVLEAMSDAVTLISATWKGYVDRKKFGTVFERLEKKRQLVRREKILRRLLRDGLNGRIEETAQKIGLDLIEYPGLMWIAKECVVTLDKGKDFSVVHDEAKQRQEYVRDYETIVMFRKIVKKVIRAAVRTIQSIVRGYLVRMKLHNIRKNMGRNNRAGALAYMHARGLERDDPNSYDGYQVKRVNMYQMYYTAYYIRESEKQEEELKEARAEKERLLQLRQERDAMRQKLQLDNMISTLRATLADENKEEGKDKKLRRFAGTVVKTGSSSVLSGIGDKSKVGELSMKRHDLISMMNQSQTNKSSSSIGEADPPSSQAKMGSLGSRMVRQGSSTSLKKSKEPSTNTSPAGTRALTPVGVKGLMNLKKGD